MKVDKNRIKNTLLFEIGVIGIDIWIKDNRGGFMEYFSNSTSKVIVYYIVLFVLVGVLYNIGLEKMKKYNKR